MNTFYILIDKSYPRRMVPCFALFLTLVFGFDALDCIYLMIALVCICFAALMLSLQPSRANQPWIGKGWSIKRYGRSFRVQFTLLTRWRPKLLLKQPGNDKRSQEHYRQWTRSDCDLNRCLYCLLSWNEFLLHSVHMQMQDISFLIHFWTLCSNILRVVYSF